MFKAVLVVAAVWFPARSGWLGSPTFLLVDDSSCQHQVTEVKDWCLVTEVRRREYHNAVSKYYDQREWFVRPVRVEHNYTFVETERLPPFRELHAALRRLWLP